MGWTAVRKGSKQRKGKEDDFSRCLWQSEDPAHWLMSLWRTLPIREKPELWVNSLFSAKIKG